MISKGSSFTYVFLNGQMQCFGPAYEHLADNDIQRPTVANDNGAGPVALPINPVRAAVLSSIRRRAADIVAGLMAQRVAAQ